MNPIYPLWINVFSNQKDTPNGREMQKKSSPWSDQQKPLTKKGRYLNLFLKAPLAPMSNNPFKESDL